MALFHTPSAVVQTASDAEIVAGAPRQLLVAEFTAGNALPGAFLEVVQLVAGDVAPQGEVQYEDFVFFDGSRAKARNGEVFADKVWPLKLPDTHPLMALFYEYEDSDKNTSPKRGKYLAYNVFNPDRGGAKGEFKINSISAASEGTHAYNISVSFRNKERIPSAQNPAPTGSGEPTFVSMSPTTGPVGTTVTTEGTNLAQILSVSVGSVEDVPLRAQSATVIVFDVPDGLTAGAQAVVLHYGEDEDLSTGNFTVS